MTFQQYLDNLAKDIELCYETSPSVEESEKLAAHFLTAQIKVGEELKKADLDSRMRKSGLKAIKAAVYLEAATKNEKKPSDVLLSAIVDSDQIVIKEQEAFDTAEVWKNQLDNYLNVFNNAHIYFRGLAKGRFD